MLQIDRWWNMSSTDDSLKLILENILSEYPSAGMELPASKIVEPEVVDVTSKSAAILLKRLKSRGLTKSEVGRGVETEFEEAVHMTWRKPLDLLDLLLDISLEITVEFTSEGENKKSKHDYVQPTLLKLQTNACLVFTEIVRLLKSGFLDGAVLLWKSLHEMVCIAYFVSKHGDDMAKRYLDYEVVENYYQALAIQDHQKVMGCESLSEKDLRAFKQLFDKMKKLYGSDFVKKSNYPYGWVPASVLKARSLKELEKSVGLDMLRPYYDVASYNVLGGPQGLMFKLGLLRTGRKSLAPVVGPSNFGLANPGRSAAISLGQITSCLLTVKPTLERLVVVEAMRTLVDEICYAFSEIEEEFFKE
jgi:hypothetical protein